MYHYIEDKKFLNQMHRVCANIVNRLVQRINNDGVIKVEAFGVGSFPKNLVTQNENGPVDIDYNLCIINTFKININNCRELKEYIRKQFNVVLSQIGWGDCEDSTSALTTEKRYFTTGNHTEFSIDLAIITNNTKTKNQCRLIHKKTGFVANDGYCWEEAPNSKKIDNKVKVLKQNNLWLELRECYLNKKNMYLIKHDNNHPSYNVYIESVNEIYYKYFN